MAASKITLRTTLDDYPHTAPIKTGEIASERIDFDWVPVKPIAQSFKAMVREQARDVNELAIVTYLQAKVYGKPIVLLPVTMLGRFQHHTMLYNTERGVVRPADLPGRRLGMRAYTQTTGAWVRGILGREYGIDLNKAHWVTFEDAHCAEYSDPPGIERAPAGKEITKMLIDGELDAAIFGGQMPTDPRLQSVVQNPHEEALKWYAKYGAVPINHMVVVTEKLAREHPDAVRELYRMLKEGKQRHGMPKPGEPDLRPFGIDAVRPSLEMIIDFALEQKLIPRRFSVDELFDDTTRSFN